MLNARRAHLAALTDEDVHEFSAFLNSLNIFNSFIIGVGVARMAGLVEPLKV